jgi:hypothetical protein
MNWRILIVTVAVPALHSARGYGWRILIVTVAVPVLHSARGYKLVNFYK